MKYLLILNFMIFANILSAQFSCDNMELLGVYFNNFNTSQLSLVLTNKSEVDDQNQNVYTDFQIVTDEGDTLLTREPCACFRLPNSVADTIVYNLELFEELGTIYDLPDEFCGRIITRFPTCEIDFCKNEIVHPMLPQLPDVDCSDYKIVGFYKTANGINDYSFLLTFTNDNFRGTGPTGYTTFEFVNENGVPLSIISGPHYTMPQYTQDTIIVHMDFYEEVSPSFCGILKTTLPECEINYCEELTSSTETFNRTELEIFPNPTTGQISISTDLAIKSVQFFNNLGQVILQENSNYFNIENLANGVYIVEVELKNKEKIKTKILKH